MASQFELLLEARDLGIHTLPDAGDAGDRRIRARVENTINRTGGERRGSWIRRLRLTPAIAASVFAVTVAAATATVLGVTAITVFRANPQANRFDRRFLKQIGQVGPSSVRLVAQTAVPGYGNVQFWGAKTTRTGGFCFALKLPNGAWANDRSDGLAALTRAGSIGGTAPGCFITRSQASIKYGESAAPLEAWEADVQSKHGKLWTIYYGYVEARGKAATVRDPRTDHTAHVNRDGYYILVDPTPTIAQAGLGPSGSTPCDGCYLGDLQVLNAAGDPLRANYPARHSPHPAAPSTGTGSASAAGGGSA